MLRIPRLPFNPLGEPTMSNGNTAIPVSPVNDIIRALNEGEAAKAKVPELQEANISLTNQLGQAQSHNMRLEENIIEYKNQISGLISKVRSLEVERDDAGFRHLEAEDKLNSLLGFMRNAATAMDDEIRFIDPPKPVPVVAEPPKADEVKGESATDPTRNTAPMTDNTGQGADTASGSDTALGNPSHYQSFTPPAPTAKPVEITEGAKSGNVDWDHKNYY